MDKKFVAAFGEHYKKSTLIFMRDVLFSAIELEMDFDDILEAIDKLLDILEAIDKLLEGE